MPEPAVVPPMVLPVAPADDRDTGPAIAHGVVAGGIDADITALDQIVVAGHFDPIAAEAADDQALDGDAIARERQSVGAESRAAPSSSIKGVLEYPGSVVPSMVSGTVIAGSGDRRSIVCGPVPKSKAIVVPPPFAST